MLKTNEINLSEQLNEFEIRKKQIEKLQLEIMEWTDKASIIQSKFNFTLPDYILNEIIENDKSKNYINLHYLINCAVVNQRLSKDNGNIIKQMYC